MFDLREAGYRSWINQDGHAVDADGNRLSDTQIVAFIASGQRGDRGRPTEQVTASPGPVAGSPPGADQYPVIDPAGDLRGHLIPVRGDSAAL